MRAFLIFVSACSLFLFLISLSLGFGGRMGTPFLFVGFVGPILLGWSRSGRPDDATLTEVPRDGEFQPVDSRDVCAKCGHEVYPGGRYCGQCGARQ